MNKVILLSDNEQLSDGAFEFAHLLHEQQRILLTGFFLPKEHYWDNLLYYAYGAAAPVINTLPDTDVLVADEAIAQFNTRCRQHDIECRVHELTYVDANEQLRIEGRFADLLLFSNNAFYEHLGELATDDCAEIALHLCECPVIVVPEDFEKPKHIILAYDGSASSVYAIKQFATLLPEFTKLETILVYANPNPDAKIPYQEYVEELAAHHFTNLTVFKLDIDPKKYFTTWLANRPDTMLVTGAKGRSGFRELFRKSFVQDILSNHMMPVFVAHT